MLYPSVLFDAFWCLRSLRLGVWCAFGYDQRDVIVLLMGADLLNFLHHGPEEPMSRQFAAPVQCLNQALLSELLCSNIERFRNAIGVKHERVTRIELAFLVGLSQSLNRPRTVPVEWSRSRVPS